MTGTRITAYDLRQMLIRAADEISAEEPKLNALDSAVGDGDHGITMRLGFEAIRQAVSQMSDSATIDQILAQAGQVFLGATGGAIGVVLGKMFMTAGRALGGATELGTPELAALLGAMETSVANGGKVKPGDKTILDAVHAAAEAVRPLAERAAGLDAALAAAATASADAAAQTAGMLCRVGRASRLGERVLGHPDPGAVSFSILLRAFAGGRS
jgi:phosphoenolpyruvate---glycerone phosphotransferase subunit DhaL